MVDAIKLVRIPIAVTCVGCHKELSFGSWAYYNAETEMAICIECGVDRGWTSKQRINKTIKLMELKEDIRALQFEKKREAERLVALRKRIAIRTLGERDLELEKQIISLMNTVQDYLYRCVARPEEKEAFELIQKEIRATQELQKKIREEVDNHLWLIDREAIRRKKRRERQKALARG